MPASAGKDFFLQINTTGSTYVNLAGLRSRSFSINGEMIDITNSDSTGLWREALGTYGVRTVSASGSGVFLDDAAFGKIISNMMTTTATYLMKVVVPGLGTFDGTFVFTKVDMNGADRDSTMYDVSIESGGAINFVSA